MPPTSFRLAASLLGFVLLYGAALYFGKTTVEDDLTQRVRRVLAVADGAPVRVTFEGRDGTLVVPPGSESNTTPAAFPLALAERVSGVRTMRLRFAAAPTSETSRMPGYAAPSGDQIRAEPIDRAASQRFLDAVAERIDLARIRFVPGTATLTPEAERVLDAVAALLAAEPAASVCIEGHMSAQTRWANAVRLSTERAQAVRAHLTARGIAPERLQAVGYGGMRPLTSNVTEAGRRANRRIALTLPL